MRECWNWQTGTFEGRVSHGVWVQVPSLTPGIKGLSFKAKSFLNVAQISSKSNTKMLRNDEIRTKNRIEDFVILAGFFR